MKFHALKTNRRGLTGHLPQRSRDVALVLGSHGGDTGNSTSMSSGSGDGEAKSEKEESLLHWRLHGGERFRFDFVED